MIEPLTTTAAAAPVPPPPESVRFGGAPASYSDPALSILIPVILPKIFLLSDL